jgi:hypothetical protein
MSHRPRNFLNWAIDTFGEIACDDMERTRRFVEEALELAHAMGLRRYDMDCIADRVYSPRPHGTIPQEIGQAQVMLECLAENMNFSADREAYLEFDRVRSIPKSEWDKRHAAKVAIGIAGQSNGS